MVAVELLCVDNERSGALQGIDLRKKPVIAEHD